MPLSPGQVLNNRYRIVKLLGQGGFGAVYRAWDTNLDYPRALKENFDTSPEAQRQFKREAQILTALSHPNLPHVIDHFIVPGQGQYLVMDYIEGEDLGTMLEKTGGPLQESQVMEWARQVCDALEYLHSRKPSIIHRDIKPANIKITPEGKAMLVDFGIAKVYDVNLSTTAGARAVTPGYSPQEQYGMGTTDARTDIYALGATLYHLLTGKQPPESVQRTIGVQLEPPVKLNPAISKKTQNAVLKAMELLPERRFQSSAEFRKAFVSKSEPPQPVQVQKQAVQSVTMPANALPRTAVQPSAKQTAKQHASQPLPWKWLGAMIALGLVALLVYVFTSGGGKGNAGLSAASDTATSPAVAVVATTRIPFLPTLPPPTSSSTPVALTAATDTPSPSAAPAETLAASPLPAQFTDEKGVEMALVPEGEFLMGSEDGSSDEQPVHTVYLDAYLIDIYEVTNARYTECVSAGACTPPGYSNSHKHIPYYGNADFDNYPVIYIDWSQARAYCQWRGGDLPSEAQWEKAARGGLAGKQYPWGDEEPDCGRANFGGAVSGCVGDNNAAGSYSPNGYGLYDMAGNAAEWVLDWYKANYYSSQSTWKNPFGPSYGEYRVIRGGSWFNGIASNLRVALRSKFAPSSSSGGIRCARSIEAKTIVLETKIPIATQIPTAEPGRTATQATLPAKIVDDFGVLMALVPAGEFLMGSEDGENDEKPVHMVYLDAYYIDAYEVTNALFEQFVQATGHQTVAEKENSGHTYFGSSWGPVAGANWRHPQGPSSNLYGLSDHPVVQMSWDDAMAYCQWRDGSLPSEAQWEKAARGGLEGKKYPWGDENPLCQKGEHNGAQFYSCGGQTVPVGSFSPNGYGLYDMAGNVWEWVLDWYQADFYANSPEENPSGPPGGEYRVLRGGSWGYRLGNLLDSATRARNDPSGRDDLTGFRCIHSP